MTCIRIVGRAIVALAVVAGMGVAIEGYTTFARWTSTPVLVYVNPQNADVDPAAASAALEWAMNEWNTRSGSSFSYWYGGRTNDTTLSRDGLNVVLFRNAGDGSALATTYSWSSNGKMLDSDIVFWDGAFRFYTGTSGCSGSGAYIEDIGVHELGHALGLSHSAITEASMYMGYRSCSQQMRTLAADDMAGAQALYPLTSAPVNRPPSIAVIAPESDATVSEGDLVTFGGSASDDQDGSLTGNLSWRSSLDGLIGVGGTFGRALTPGHHVITVTVTDSGGLTSEVQLALAVLNQTSGTTLEVSAYKVKGLKKADLKWRGITDTAVEISRNGTTVANVTNGGAHTDSIDAKGGGTYQYKVCGVTTSSCTDVVSAQF